MHETLQRSSLGALGAGARSTSSCRCAPATASADTSCRATSTAPGTVRAIREEGFSRVVEIEAEPELRALPRREGLGRARRRQPDRRARSASDGFAVSLIPETLERTTLGALGAGGGGQHRGRHPRQARRAAAGGTRMSDRRTTTAPFATIEEAIEDIRAGQDGRRLRRRGPRERGRPDDGGAVRDARGDQLHGQGGARADLPVADPRALRRARARPDGGEERVRRSKPPSPSRSRRARASPPASPRTTARTRSRSRSTPRAARATSSSPGTSSRSRAAPAACSSAPGRPRRRSTSRGSRA